MMPGMGVDPKKLAQIQVISKSIKATIVISKSKRYMVLNLSSDNKDPGVQQMIDTLLEQFTTSTAQQLQSFFAIKGEIQEA
jgi:hypothetical protein